MMLKRRMTILLVCMFLLLAACGCSARTTKESEMNNTQPATETTMENDGNNTQPATENLAETDAPEDGQNPVMNVVGVYSCDRASIQVEAEGAENARITVTWGGSYNENAVWVMSGKLDTEDLSVYYQDCVKTIVIYQENGEAASEEEVYANGHGFFFFDGESNALTWQDDQENMGDGMTFLLGDPEPEAEPQETELDSGDPAFYNAVTAMDKAAVEEIADSIRAAYLNEDWASLTDLIRYPITINETELAEAGAFLSYMSEKTVHESDHAAMEEETGRDMFFNGQGICMGSGQVWIIDPNYMTEETPQLQIIAINGIVER